MFTRIMLSEGERKNLWSRDGPMLFYCFICFQCAQLCLNERTFVCRSFNYRRGDDQCTLTELNANMTGGLMPDIQYNYFEIIIQSGTFRLYYSNTFSYVNRLCVFVLSVCPLDI